MVRTYIIQGLKIVNKQQIKRRLSLNIV